MIGFFDIRNGCAGDMICAALAGCVDIEEIKRQLEKISFPSKYEIEIRRVTRTTGSFHGIKANQFIVHVKGKEQERPYSEIIKVFEESGLSKSTRNKIIRVFEILAYAESKVHNESIANLHFHAVGQTDALVEISFAILALEKLCIERVFSSPVGISYAAPATMEMLSDIPVIIRNIPFETATPTGIALIRAITESFNDTPVIIPGGHCYGTGTIDTDIPNTLHFIYGKEINTLKDYVSVIETSVDDMNPVVFEYLIDKLYQSGALEVCFFVGITKKSRPIFWIRVLCEPALKGSIIQHLFKETTTLGIRYREEQRIVLARSQKKIKTRYGDMSVKIGYISGDIVNIMPEYEECKKAAQERKIPIKKVIEEVLKSANMINRKNRL
ncbi:MAG: LarC family nickel insertion protein [Candidatus Omnitrophica bacterium]|nr:LarC family nickel insertion protein [Candidatus Omnitrophota bacterium]